MRARAHSLNHHEPAVVEAEAEVEVEVPHVAADEVTNVIHNVNQD